MKTSNLSIRNLTQKLSVLFIIAAAFLTSCQKDPVAPSNLEPQIQTKIARIAAPAYSVVTIDHTDPQRVMPSYKVELLSDGTINFEGRENTTFIGKIQAIASLSQVDKINFLFFQSSFKNMLDIQIMDGDAQVATTYTASNGSSPITHVDNTKKAQALVALRNQVEQILQIGKWVK